LIWPVFWVSAAVLGFEIGLLRLLLVASWSHFAFLVISIALLGFGASGTALTLAARPLLRHGDRWLTGLALACGLAMIMCTAAARRLPADAFFPPAHLWREIAWWSAYWVLLGVPFFLGAASIGLALMMARAGAPTVYAANLLGSALGALAAPLLTLAVPPHWLAPAWAVLAALAALPRRHGKGRGRAPRRWLPWTLAAALGAAWVLLDPPRVRVDQHKYSSRMHQLLAQGEVRRIASALGPRGLIELYSGPSLHDLPFLGLGAAPPPIGVVVIDGHWSGSVLEVDDAAGAAAVEATMMAAPYALLPPGPRVALLGEIGSANVWLALRRGATSIDVVQPHARLPALLRRAFAARGGAVFDQPGVRCARAEPRHFIDGAAGELDLIQLVTLEGSAAGSAGLGGLAQDHLLTVEGMSACLDRLSDAGLLAACRGIQEPPRDDVKLLLMLHEALRRRGIAEPERHIAIVRDFLAVCMMVRPAPWTAGDVERLRALCRTRSLTPVWFPGIEAAELNKPDALPGPPGEAGDWLHHAALMVSGGRMDELLRAWRFDVRPATDDRPFFHDFCALRSTLALREAFGDLWLTRVELAFLFVLAAAAAIALAGALLTVAPLLLLRRIRAAPRTGGSALYFGAIGLGYMLLEMASLARLTHMIGDAVTATSLTIAGYLLFSGLGSLTAQRLRLPRHRAFILLALGVMALGATQITLAPFVAVHAAPWPAVARCALALVLVAPAAYLMGFPMALGLRRGGPALVPWAWGVNGFASVLASPLALIIGMSAGFGAAALCGAACYGLAALAYGVLPAAPAPSLRCRSS
jgi:hypothetical protein